jgi:hypothetical protein
MDPDDTMPVPSAPPTIPAPPMFVELFDSVDQEPPKSGPHLRDLHAARFDWDGFASEALDDDVDASPR